jgi:CcmD family protein
MIPTQDTPGTSAPGTTGAPSATSAPANGFTAVDGRDGRENFNGGTLLVEAYAAIWLVIMGWILLLWRKQASMRDRLDDLERTIDRAAAERERTEKKAKAKAS